MGFAETTVSRWGHLMQVQCLSYGDLLKQLERLSPDELAQSATVFHEDEYFPVVSFFFEDKTTTPGALDEGHLVLKTPECEFRYVKPREIFDCTYDEGSYADALEAQCRFLKLNPIMGFNAVNIATMVPANIGDDETVLVLGEASFEDVAQFLQEVSWGN